jgi:hypothetical protein
LINLLTGAAGFKLSGLKLPIVNLEDQPGKTVGRLRTGPEAYDRLVKNAAALMPRLPFPKGVYKFKSHEEADEWMNKHILEAAVKKLRARQSKVT